VATSRK